MSGKDDAEEVHRYMAPYSARHPIPTISRYKEERAERQEKAALGDDASSVAPAQDDHPEKPAARADDNQRPAGEPPAPSAESSAPKNESEVHDGDDARPAKDTSEIDPGSTDPKQRRKDMKQSRKERARREVTDPVTHLPVTIQDFTDDSLREIEANYPAVGSTERTASGPKAKAKSDEEIRNEQREAQQGHDAMRDLFPPPDFDALRQELTVINKRGITFGLAGAVAILGGALALDRLVRRSLPGLGGLPGFGRDAAISLIAATSAGAVWVLVVAVREWTANKINNIFQDEVWDSHRRSLCMQARNHDTESTVWLNSLLGSVWPLVNPDLFASLADTLEDVMQASLPNFVRMVSVDDIGQGSEALRILGVKWLPTGAAARSVDESGNLVPADGRSHKSSTEEESGSDAEDAPPNGMEAEEGDFINLEVAFAYRTRSSSKSLRKRTKNMHLYLAFYLPGNIKLPVWVDLQGMIGVMRLRLQLTPDPPFFALCTMTFLGQPKVNLSCVPLSQHALNIMDLPFISNFVQSAVDAAMAEYVAPKSLTLDLKDMLAGDDFKKDTVAVGLLVVTIKRGYDFKMGDSGIPLIKDGSSDPYVSVGWAKFGKVLWSTRVLESEMAPVWNETCYILVTPAELNISERLRVQLWDSDRLTADDDLGRIEVRLKDIMRDSESNGRMAARTDSFRALTSGENMPGRLEWSVGYFSKTRIQQCQFDKQTYDPKIRSMEALEEKVTQSCERKLRETMLKENKQEQDESDKSELEQQKAQELKAEQDAMMISAPPPDGYPSGLFSIQIHNITGLEVKKLSKQTSLSEDSSSDEEEAGDGLPSAYCSIIVNHRKTFKTRTKPQNAKPFYNAGCERFIRDWKDAEIFVAVRDARLREDDPLLGLVHLPLGELFKERSQVMGFWPLTGGIGHGRIRLSMVWRSVQLQAPRNMLGWQYGTLQIGAAAAIANCPKELRVSKLKFATTISRGKMYAASSSGDDASTAIWSARRERSLALAVQSRYSSCLSIAFRDKGFFDDDTAAFSVLWLKDLVDEEETELELPVWKGNFRRATANCLEECGQKLATVKLKVTFWSGLGSAHARWASKDASLRDVIEVIETARENMETIELQREAGIIDDEDSGKGLTHVPSMASKSDASSSSSSSSFSSDSESDDERSWRAKLKKKKEIPDGSSEHKQGPIDQVRDYRRRDKRLHRQHRGIMQWKIPRTARWIKHRFDRVGDNVSNVFEHSSKQPGIETEV